MAKREGFHTFYQGAEERQALQLAFEAAGGQNVEFKGSYIANFDVETMGSGIARCDLGASGAAELRARGIALYPGRQIL